MEKINVMFEKPRNNNNNDNDDDRQAMQAIMKKGLIPQHEFLVSKGYTSSLRNLKALIRSQGDTQQAIILLNNQQNKHQERMNSKLEKIEHFKKRREGFQQESKMEKYEK